MISATPGTATRRRELRRLIRNRLGASSRPAPELADVLVAADCLSELLLLASGGQMSLRVRNFNYVETVSVREALTIARTQA